MFTIPSCIEQSVQTVIKIMSDEVNVPTFSHVKMFGDLYKKYNLKSEISSSFFKWSTVIIFIFCSLNYFLRNEAPTPSPTNLHTHILVWEEYNEQCRVSWTTKSLALCYYMARGLKFNRQAIMVIEDTRKSGRFTRSSFCYRREILFGLVTIICRWWLK